MERQRIAYLYERHKANRLTTAESAEWDELLADEANENALKAIVGADWDALGARPLQSLPATRAQRVLREILLFPQRRVKRRLWRYTAAAAAAVLVVAFLYYWQVQNAFTDRPWIAHVEAEAVDGVHREILPDGTIIWLRPGARLHYKKPFDRRDVVLTGEALFEVAKIPERPFRVQVGDYEATVKGTSFNIRQAENGKDMELVVLTGEVAVRKREPVAPVADASPERPNEVVLQPNQRLKTEAGLTLEAPPVETVELPHDNEYTQGTAYNMWLDDTPFDEVVRRISDKFGVKVTAADDLYRNCRISADLSDQSLEYTVELVAAALGAEYEITKNRITLKGGGCL